MTQYLLSVHSSDADYDTPLEDMQPVFETVDAFNTQLQNDGRWVFAGGLERPSTATVVDGTGSETVVTDGPYIEAKELLGGFWVIEAADLDEALKVAAEASAACRGKVEVRPFQGE